jgi:adenylate cyclase
VLSNIASRFASEPADTQEVRSEKIAIFLVAVACSVAGIIWATLYAVVFGWGLTTALPLGFSVVVGSSLVISHATRNHQIAIYAQTLSILLFPAIIQWSIGGLFDSGITLAWAILGPLGALMFFSLRKSSFWFLTYFLIIGITVAFDGYFSDNALDVSENVRRLFFAMNIGVSSMVVFGFAGYFVSRALKERSEANRLLLNVLPAEIAETLKQSEETIARQHESVSVLFADVVGSTPLFADLEPTEVVDTLNEVFSVLDVLVERHGLEKLRTMGDGSWWDRACQRRGQTMRRHLWRVLWR